MDADPVTTLGLPGVFDELLASDRRAAGAALFEAYHLRIFRYLRARGASDEDAADLAGATFERAIMALPRFRHRAGGVAAWLFRIARNAEIDARRRGRNGRSASLLSTLVDRRTVSPEASAIERESMAELAARVDRLSKEAREALALRYAAGLTAREIASVLGKSEAATQKLLSRALDALREAYRAAG